MWREPTPYHSPQPQVNEDEQYIVEALHKAAQEVEPKGRLEDITRLVGEDQRSSALALIGTVILTAASMITWLVIWAIVMRHATWMDHQPLPRPMPLP